jgi:alpha 1,2-mannosyltransferase
MAGVVLALFLLSLRALVPQEGADVIPVEWLTDPQIAEVLRPAPTKQLKRPREDPEEWIKRQSALANDFKARQPKQKAALISLVRNEELDGILQSMRQLEYHWNHVYEYPWIFFSEKPFTDEFKVSSAAIAPS